MAVKAEPDHTISKSEAHYKQGTPKRNCGLCSMYRSGGSCTLVEGAIRPVDVCDYFEARKTAKTAAKKGD